MITLKELSKLIDTHQVDPKQLAEHLHITEEKLFENIATNHFSAMQRSAIHVFMKTHRKSNVTPHYQIEDNAIDSILTDAKHAPYKERFEKHISKSNKKEMTLEEIIELTYIVPTTTVSFWLKNKDDLTEIMTRLDANPRPLIDGFKSAYREHLTLYTRTIPYRAPSVELEREPLRKALVDKLEEKHLDYINELNEFSAHDKDIVVLLNKPTKTIKMNVTVAHALHMFLFPTQPFTYPHLDWQAMFVPVHFIRKDLFSKTPGGLNSKTRATIQNISFKTLFKNIIQDNLTLAQVLAFETLDSHDKDIAYDIFSRAIKYYQQHKLELPSLENTPFAKSAKPYVTLSSLTKTVEEKPTDKPVEKHVIVTSKELAKETPKKPVKEAPKELVKEAPETKLVDESLPKKPNNARDVSVDLHTSQEFLNKQKSTDKPVSKSGKERLSSIAVYLEEALKRQQDINITYNKNTGHTIIQIAVSD